MSVTDRRFREILESALAGKDVTPEQGIALCQARGPELHALVATADEMRRRQVGDVGTYIVNRNINFTNVCIKHCSFCAFSRDQNHREAYFLPIERVVELGREAQELGATELCIQAGLPPQTDGWHYVNLVRALKRAMPNVHLHAFSPEELHHGATRAGVSVREFLIALKEAGLDTLPGTSAEILDDEIRRILAKARITTKQWVDVVTTAHDLGFRTTATIMYGHVETYAHWMRHMIVLRDIQEQTGGFTEFVPLSFVHDEAPIHLEGRVANLRRGPSGTDVVKMHALARIVLGRHIRNIQASWVKEGTRLAQQLLTAGANDVGGTLFNESISTTAGANHGQFVSPADLRRMIREAGMTPAERTSVYAIVRKFHDSHVPDSALDRIADPSRRFGSHERLVHSTEFRYSQEREVSER